MITILKRKCESEKNFEARNVTFPLLKKPECRGVRFEKVMEPLKFGLDGSSRSTGGGAVAGRLI